MPFHLNCRRAWGGCPQGAGIDGGFEAPTHRQQLPPPPDATVLLFGRGGAVPGARRGSRSAGRRSTRPPSSSAPAPPPTGRPPAPSVRGQSQDVGGGSSEVCPLPTSHPNRHRGGGVQWLPPPSRSDVLFPVPIPSAPSCILVLLAITFTRPCTPSPASCDSTRKAVNSSFERQPHPGGPHGQHP